MSGAREADVAAMSSEEQHDIFVQGVMDKYGPEAKRLLTEQARLEITFQHIYDYMATLDSINADAFKAAVMDINNLEFGRLARSWRDDVIAQFVAARLEAKAWDLYNERDD